MLFDNKLDLVRLLKMLFTYKGLKFFFNRREEIIGLMLSRSVMADYQKEEWLNIKELIALCFVKY